MGEREIIVDTSPATDGVASHVENGIAEYAEYDSDSDSGSAADEETKDIASLRLVWPEWHVAHNSDTQTLR